MSSAGAQHKLAVVVRDGQLFEPSGQAASTHILKPNHAQTNAYPSAVVNEWFGMKLAANVDPEVPNVERRYAPAPVYLIERFKPRDAERYGGAPAPARVRLFRWLVFCVLVGNGDSHLKNTSFLVTAKGITSAPFYDLLCEAVYETRNYSDKDRWPDLTEFTREVCGVRRYADFSREVLEEAGEQLDLTRTTAARQITELLTRIPAEATALLT